MKRSEMINIISKYLIEETTCKWYDTTHDDVARAILNIVEKNGMKAPISKTCPVLLTTKHEWEMDCE